MHSLVKSSLSNLSKKKTATPSQQPVAPQAPISTHMGTYTVGQQPYPYLMQQHTGMPGAPNFQPQMQNLQHQLQNVQQHVHQNLVKPQVSFQQNVQQPQASNVQPQIQQQLQAQQNNVHQDAVHKTNRIINVNQTE